MPTIIDLAGLAGAAYDDKGSPFSSWRRVARIPMAKGWSGFSGAAFAGPRGALAVAFRGSEGPGDDFIRDWIVNDAAGIGTKVLPIAQASHATEFADAAIARHGRNGKPVYVVGHSLGGALAQIVAGRRKGTIGVTFNAPGVRDHFFALFQNWENETNVLNLRADGDPVSKFGKHVGRKPITFGSAGLPTMKGAMAQTMQAVTEGLFIGLKTGSPTLALATAAAAGSAAGGKVLGKAAIAVGRAHTMGAVLEGLRTSRVGRRTPEALLG
jgi:pimeloyl-ACP methyl ester carboxylesterase